MAGRNFNLYVSCWHMCRHLELVECNKSAASLSEGFIFTHSYIPIGLGRLSVWWMLSVNKQWPSGCGKVVVTGMCLSLSFSVGFYRIIQAGNKCVCLFPGALNQSECEEECLSEHTESGRPAQRVLHHLLRRTHNLHLPTDGHTHTFCVDVDSYTNTYKQKNSTILDCWHHQSCWFLILCLLWTGQRKPTETDTLTGWMHLRERPEDSPDLLPLWLFVRIVLVPCVQSAVLAGLLTDSWKFAVKIVKQSVFNPDLHLYHFLSLMIL